jgi:hypothetical protein
MYVSLLISVNFNCTFTYVKKAVLGYARFNALAMYGFVRCNMVPEIFFETLNCLALLVSLFLLCFSVCLFTNITLLNRKNQRTLSEQRCTWTAKVSLRQADQMNL